MTWELTPELADKICEELTEGRSLRSICKDDGMPSIGTVFRWLASNEEFCKQYAHARDAQADTLADDCLDISDNAKLDVIKDEVTGGFKIDGEAVARARLRVDTRKWYAGKLKPKKYGDSTTVKGDAENPLNLVSIVSKIGNTRELPQISDE